MVARSQKLGWSINLLWFITTTLGWAIYWSPLLGTSNSMLTTLSLTSGIWDVTYSLGSAIGGVIAGAIGGIILGLGQQKFIRAPDALGERQPTRWLLRTVVGISLGWAISQYMLYPVLLKLRVVYGWELGTSLERGTILIIITEAAAFSGAIIGALVGISQWLALRHWLPRAWWWIIASIVGWTVGSVACWLIYGLLGGPFCQTWGCLDQGVGPNYYLAMTSGWIVGGIVAGAITGGAFRLLVGPTTPIYPGTSEY